MDRIKMQTNKCCHALIKIQAFYLFICINCLSSVQAEDWIYKVRFGDNLWNLTIDYLIDTSYVKRVQNMNKITNPKEILPGTLIRIPSEWIKHYPMLIRVHNLQGTAQVLNEESNHPQELKVGMILILGDTISTDADSTLTLGFLDGSQIMLEENSRLIIENMMLLEYTGMSDVNLELEEGRLETQITPNTGTARRFIIKTPATVTSVRGTDYRISSEKEKKESKTEVLEGKVLVKGLSQHQLLPTGFGTVTVEAQEPIPPVKLLPAPNIKQLPNPFALVPLQFSVVKSNKTHGFRVQIAKTGQFNDVFFDKLFNTTIIRGPDLPDGDYHIRVRALDSHFLEGHNAQRQIKVNARPESPFLVSPKQDAGILLEEDPEFVWSDQQGVGQYHFQVSKTQGFTDILIDMPTIGDNEITISKELGLGKYYWRIAAIDHDGDGPFSDGQMFRRIIPAPEIDAPEITDDTVMIRSRKGLPGQTYHFQMADDDTFNDLLVDKYTDEPGFEIPRPTGGEYFIRVRTIDPDGFVGPFATPQSIDIPYDLYWLLALLPLLALLAL